MQSDQLNSSESSQEEFNNVEKIMPKNDFTIITRSERWLVYSLMCIIFLVSYFDGGIIPAATKEIERDLSTNQAGLGMFGSSDFLGRIIGSIIWVYLINSVNRRVLLTISLIFRALTLSVCLLTNDYWIIFATKGLSGLSAVYWTIYFPLWCDQYGSKKSRTMMIAIMNVASPLGIVCGFVLCTLCKKNWTLSLGLQSIFIVIFALINLFVPPKFFSKKLNQIKIKENLSNDEENNDNNKENDNIEIALLPSSKVEGALYFQSVISTKSTSNIIKNISKLITNPLFMTLIFAHSLNFYAITSIRFWCSNYWKEVINISDDNVIMIAFSAISLTAPTFGLLFGGACGTFIGGYSVKGAIILCLIFDTIANVSGIFSSFMYNFYIYCTLLWIMFFFSTAVVPIELGIIVVSVGLELKSDGFSFANFVVNLIGNLPSAFIYGLIDDYYHKAYKSLAMNCVFYVRLINVILLTLGCVFRYRMKDDLDDKINDKEEEKETKKEKEKLKE